MTIIPYSSVPPPPLPSDPPCNIESWVRHIRRQLEAALGGSIGTYAFDGKTIPAVAVLQNHQEQFPKTNSTVTVTGLELVIFYPAPITQPEIGGYQVEWESTIHLKQWDTSKDLYGVLERILEVRELDIKQTLPVPGNEQMGIPEMLQLLVHIYFGYH